MEEINTPSTKTKTWLQFVKMASYGYAFGFALLGLLSSTEFMYEEDKKFWSLTLLILNIAYCFIALIHLFHFDRKGKLIAEPELSKHSNLLLCICPFSAAVFDPLKPILIKSQIVNPDAYFITGIISAFIIFAVAHIIIAFLASKKTDKKTK